MRKEDLIFVWFFIICIVLGFAGMAIHIDHMNAELEQLKKARVK